MAEIILRQVDAASAPVLGHVLPVLDQLQCATNLVGQNQLLGAAGTDDLQHNASDGGGRQPAVLHQLVKRLVAHDVLILQICLDQVLERLLRQTATEHRGCEPAQHGCLRRAAVPHRGEVASKVHELRRAIAWSGVAQLIDDPDDVVDRTKIGSQLRGQDAQRHRKVLGAFLLAERALALQHPCSRRRPCTHASILVPTRG
jgi:hypothetical protein